LLATLSVFFVLGALNTYWGYAAERHGRPAVKHYLDAIANVLALLTRAVLGSGAKRLSSQATSPLLAARAGLLNGASRFNRNT